MRAIVQKSLGVVLPSLLALASFTSVAWAADRNDLPPPKVEPAASSTAKPDPSPPLPLLSQAAPAASPSGAVIETPVPRMIAFTAGWRDGFFVQSEDENFILRLTGQLQADFRGYVDNRDTTDITTFLVRRARLGIEATMLKYYEFRLLPDFAPTGAQGISRVQDAYMNVHYWDCFQIEAGKFKQPFSYEQLIQDRYVPTAERSLIDQLVPARDEGVMIHGRNLLENRLDYAVSVSNGEINGDIDTNGNKDLVGRLAVRPFQPPFSLPFLEGLQVGMAATIGKEQESLGSVILRTPAQVPWFQFNSTVRADGMRTRYSPELVYFFQGFGIAAQYFHEDQQVRPNSVGPSSRLLLKVPEQGFYVMSTLLLTGEERTDYSQPIAPLRNFDPVHPLASPGAIELVARVSKLHLNSKVFAPGLLNLADPTKFGDGATECTVGFNWYLTKWVRMQANWEHAWFDQPVLLGSGPFGKLKEQDTIITRLQVIF